MAVRVSVKIHLRVCLRGALLALAWLSPGGAALAADAPGTVLEEHFALPVSVRDIYGKEVSQPITVTVFRDASRARAPFLVLNHGRAGQAAERAKLGRARYSDNARWFVSQGFAVFVPTRVGYGVSGGEDVEYSGTCQHRMYGPTFEAAVQQTLAVMAHARTQPWVDPDRGVIAGQSYGGTTAVAMAAIEAPGVLATINFAGGGGGDPVGRPEQPCREDQLRALYAEYGATARRPVLWLYSENDRYWGRELPHAWFKAWSARGGKGEFVQLPPSGSDGHGSFTRSPAHWKPAVEAFLRGLGFAATDRRND